MNTVGPPTTHHIIAIWKAVVRFNPGVTLMSKSTRRLRFYQVSQPRFHFVYSTLLEKVFLRQRTSYFLTSSLDELLFESKPKIVTGYYISELVFNSDNKNTFKEIIRSRIKITMKYFSEKEKAGN